MPKLTQAQEEQLKILRAVADGTLPEYLEGSHANLPHDIARELHQDGMFTGDPYKLISGRTEYPGAKSTSRGRDLLEQLEQLSLPDQATQPANAEPPKGGKHEWHKNPFLITSLIVVGGVLVVFIVQLLREHLGLALP